LHRALKDVLGAHVNQQGSYVGPDRLRFDFSHPRGVAPEELERIEGAVSAQIAANAPLVTTVEDLAAAKARGVVALFGEKYDQRVRVVTVGDYSSELCGGTHVRAAGDIGAFLITSERAIQAGVRRIEALTGAAAVAEVQRQRRLLIDAARLLKSGPDELPARIEQLQAQVKEARKQGEKSSAAGIDGAFAKLATLLASQRAPSGVAWAVVSFPELDLKALGELGARAKAHSKDLALALFGREEGRVPFAVCCQGQALVKGLKAGELAKLAAAHVGGGGGGRPEMAQGQGQDPAGLPAAIEALSTAFARALA
jgi:alanyl-tRNA synthetase